MNKERDIEIDILKFIGLVGLIASHTFTDNLILQIRSFDVNLLVIISAYLVDRSQNNHSMTYYDYCKKRVKRLLFPTWIFITIYLIANICFKFQEYTIKQIVRSYLLLNNSIGYVWIIYVYLICAVIMPFLIRIETSSIYAKAVYIVGNLIYLCLASVSDSYVYQLVVLYPIAYGLISFLGILISRDERALTDFIMISGLLIFALNAIVLYKSTGKFIVTGEYKYPPRLYYLSYSLSISILLFRFRSVLMQIVTTIRMTKVVTFVSKHSLWIYLWHILALQIVLKLGLNQLFSFVVVITMSIAITLIQGVLVDKLENRGISDNILSLFRG